MYGGAERSGTSLGETCHGSLTMSLGDPSKVGCRRRWPHLPCHTQMRDRRAKWSRSGHECRDWRSCRRSWLFVLLDRGAPLGGRCTLAKVGRGAGATKFCGPWSQVACDKPDASDSCHADLRPARIRCRSVRSGLAVDPAGSSPWRGRKKERMSMRSSARPVPTLL